MQGPNRQLHYTRFIGYGLGHTGRKSEGFERRSKKSFNKWLRHRLKKELHEMRY